MDLKVVGWTNYESPFPSADVTEETMDEVVFCVASEIRANGYMISGMDHQYTATGVPVFNDGTCLRASMRSWGMIMSVAYPELNGKETGYMDFYMDVPDKSVLPKETEINASPADSDNFFGMIVKNDGEMLAMSIKMKMPLKTNDKCIEAIYKSYMPDTD